MFYVYILKLENEFNIVKQNILSLCIHYKDGYS